MLLTRTIAIGALVLATTHCGKPHDTDATKPLRAAPTTEPAPELTAASTASTNTGGTRARLPVDGLPIIGSELALVTIVEFTDFECPFCARASGTLAKLREAYADDEVRIAVAMHPLPSHAHARPAALAALAAAEQGKMEAMQTQLFSTAKSLDPAGLRRSAALVGLDVARFDAARQGPQAEKALLHAEALGQIADVKGTPTFFINGRRVVGARCLEMMKKIVDEELVNARALLARGIRREHLYTELLETPAPKELDLDEEGSIGGGGGDCRVACNAPVDDSDEDEPVRDTSVKRKE